MEVETPAASLLVISQTNYPGWHVSVNDKPAHLYQTSFAFQGVAVPPGRSRVVLEFWSARLMFSAGKPIVAATRPNEIDDDDADITALRAETGGCLGCRSMMGSAS
jgi:Bacterial membrane protein YfhO